jgi:uncharacterized membrane protein YccC
LGQPNKEHTISDDTPPAIKNTLAGRPEQMAAPAVDDLGVAYAIPTSIAVFPLRPRSLNSLVSIMPDTPTKDTPAGSRHRSISGWLRRLAGLRPLRLAVQTAGGAALAFGIAKSLGLPDVSWVVFSAVFVVQSSIGGTIRSAARRMAGGGAGLLLGLIAIFAFGSGGWQTFAGLVTGVAAMAALSALRPGLSYGLVTVTMLVLAPGVEVVEGSVLKAGEIALGTLCGAAAAAAVMPRAAHRQVDEHLANALRSIGAFIGRDRRHFVDGPQNGPGVSRDAVETELAQARDLLRQSQPRLRSTSAAVDARDELRREIERFWYGVVLLDQLVEPFPHAGQPGPIAEPIDRVIRDSADHLQRLSACIRQSQPPKPWSPPAAAMKSLDECSRELSVQKRAVTEVQHLFAISFTCKQIAFGVERIDKAARSALGGVEEEAGGEKQLPVSRQ